MLSRRIKVISNSKRAKKDLSRENILLALLPFWTPLIPPMGIACLKAFLQQYGCKVKTVDVNGLDPFKKIYNRYFEILKNVVPENKRGNFLSIGHDVLQNHMTAYLNSSREDKTGYNELIKTLVFKTFYSNIPGSQLEELDQVVADFYIQLEAYFLDLLEKQRPTVLGISINNCTLPASILVLQLTKKNYPGIRTLVGGGIFCDQLAMGTPNFDIFLEKTQNSIDHIIIGEGELLFLKFLNGELPETQRVFTLQDIDRETLELSNAPQPDFSDFHLPLYPYLSAYTSRSCPFQCSFCSDSLMWGKYRKKKAIQVFRELSQLSRDYDYQLFMLSDLLLNPIISELAGEFTRSEIAVYWDGCLRVDKGACSTKNTQLWRRGGFYKARLGLESGSPRILEAMGKKITLPLMKETLASLAFAGIQTTTLWIVGYPGETEDDFLQTLNLIEESKEDIYEAECRPFYYYLKGQAASNQWGKNHKPIPLYPPEAAKMLLLQTWILEGVPSREETYKRVTRFVQHCNRLGIPNIYSLHDSYQADERWKKLHKNAVPSLLDFKKKHVYIDECKQFADTYFIDIENKPIDSGDFCF
jgi:hypothetical protein